MASITPAAVAEVFRSSVEFDMVVTSTMDIVSASQLSFHSDCFAELLDGGSFRRILKGIKGLGRNVRGIFEELHDADLGIVAFADRRIRETPRRVIAQFLNRPEYSYHENDIAELYFAVNTWLAFFGDSEISEEWEACPMCGSPMRDYVCTAAGCKTGSYVAHDAMLSFEKYLLDTASGIDAEEPELWHKIMPGSEFYRVYKQQVDGYHGNAPSDDGDLAGIDELASILRSVASEPAQDASETVFDLGAVETALESPTETAPAVDRAKVMETAKGKVRSYEMQIRLEKMKDSPDFDRILEEFRADSDILEAMTADGDAFAELFDGFVRLVGELKSEAEESLRQKKLAERYAERSAELRSCLCRIAEVLASIDPRSEDRGAAELLRELLTTAESASDEVIRGWKTGVLADEDGSVAEAYSRDMAAELREFADTVLRLDEITEAKLELYSREAETARGRAEDSFVRYKGELYSAAEGLGAARERLVSELTDYYGAKAQADSARTEFTAELCRTRDGLSSLMTQRFAHLYR